MTEEEKVALELLQKLARDLPDDHVLLEMFTDDIKRALHIFMNLACRYIECRD